MARVIWHIQSSFYHLFRKNPLSARILRQENEAIRTLLQRLKNHPVKTGLDIGSGRGNSLKLIPPGDASWMAIDYSHRMIRSCRKHYANVCFVLGDARQMPFMTASFDLVLCIGVSEYLEDLNRFLGEICTLLKPGGYAVLTLAPPNMLNFFRWMIGHRIFPVRETDLKNQLIHIPFMIKARNHTVLQSQYLLMKKERR